MRRESNLSERRAKASLAPTPVEMDLFERDGVEKRKRSRFFKK
jgi:hypothetical protein